MAENSKDDINRSQLKKNLDITNDLNENIKIKKKIIVY